jgi:hypothetical protein
MAWHVVSRHGRAKNFGRPEIELLSKVGNVFLAREIARQLSSNGVVSIVSCAGLFCGKLRAENGS